MTRARDQAPGLRPDLRTARSCGAGCGFGDITAKSQAARLVVTGQMIDDLVILGLAIKVIVGAVSRRRQPADTSGTQPAQEIAASRDKPASHDA